MSREVRSETYDEEEVFFQAKELKDPSARDKFLNEACDNEVQKSAVRELLRLDETSDTFLETPAIAGTRHALTPSDDRLESGTCLGPYKILRKIGYGGSGDVYAAEQLSPVQRQVAIKLLRTDSNRSAAEQRSILDRFRDEQQTLATLQHPGIAKLIDAGITDQNRSYFVMELVDAVPLDHFLNDHEVSFDQRIDLVLQICAAVSYAHQKGVIHRDLKPSNVLISQSQEKRSHSELVATVIDFGIAKLANATSSQLSRTLDGQLLGTPGYMSPEQVQDPDKVDTRVDVYAIGAILFHCLAGKSPVEACLQRPHNLHDAFQAILNQDPPPPSSFRVTDGNFPSEADWIVEKALKKSADQRYSSVGEFAKDVQRMRVGEAVSVGPPTIRYQVGKWIARNRMTSIAIVSVILSVLLGSLLALVGLQQAQIALTAEQQAKQSVIVQRDRSEKMIQLLSDLAGASNTNRDHPIDYSVRQLLIDFAEDLDEKLAGQPDVEIRLRHILGRAFSSHGDANRAVENLQRCRELYKNTVEIDPSEAASIDVDLSRALIRQSKPSEALEVLSLAIDSGALSKRDLVWGHSANSKIMRTFGQRRRMLLHAELAYSTAQAIALSDQARPTDGAIAAVMLAHLAHAQGLAGRTDQADENSIEALRQLESDHHRREVDLAIAQRVRAKILQRRGELREAESLIRSARSINEKMLGPSDQLVSDLIQHSQILRQANRFREASKTSRQATLIADSLQSNRGSASILAYENDATLSEGNDDDRAKEAWDKTCDGTRELTGNSESLAMRLFLSGRFHRRIQLKDEAFALFSESLEFLDVVEHESIKYQSLLYEMGTLLVDKGQLTEAEEKLNLLRQSKSDFAPLLSIEVSLAKNEIDDAQQTFLDLDDASLPRVYQAEAMILHARVNRALGDHAAADQQIQNLLDLTDRRKGPLRSYRRWIDDLSDDQ